MTLACAPLASVCCALPVEARKKISVCKYVVFCFFVFQFFRYHTYNSTRVDEEKQVLHSSRDEKTKARTVRQRVGVRKSQRSDLKSELRL